MDYMQLLSSLGRNGDTMLAHINPQEAELLKALGGAGTTNPETGLSEFYDAAGMGGAPGAGGDVGGSGLSGAAGGGGAASGGGMTMDPSAALPEVNVGAGRFATGTNVGQTPQEAMDYAATHGPGGGSLFGNIIASEGWQDPTVADLGPLGLVKGSTIGNTALNMGLSLAGGALMGLPGLFVGAVSKGAPIANDMLGYQGSLMTSPNGTAQAAGTNSQNQGGGVDPMTGLPIQNSATAATTTAATTTPTSTQNLASSLGIDANILDMLLRSGVSQV